MSSSVYGEAALLEGDRMTKRVLLFQTTKYTQAAELFTTASNYFRLNADWAKVAESLIRCAECYEKLKEQEQAATCYLQAAHSLKRCDSADASTYYRLAAGIFAELNQTNQSAKLLKEAGEVHEKFLELDDALLCYEHAARYFESLQSKSFAIGCLIKVAEISSQLHEFGKAAMIYQKIARDAKGNQVLKWKVKEYLFRAGLMLLCSKNMRAARNSLSSFKTIDRSFSTTPEYALLKEFISAYGRYDYESAMESIEFYCKSADLDPWKASTFIYILSLVKDVPSP